MPLDIRKASGSRRRIELVNVTDFSGGLNKSADQFGLGQNETPDCLNVDFDRRGGFSLRPAFSDFSTTTLSNVERWAGVYRNAAGIEQALFAANNQVYRMSSGGVLTSLALAGAYTGTARAATFNDKCYIQRMAAQVAVKWDGAAATNLTASAAAAWQEDYTQVGTHMPKAKFIASHLGYLWVANTIEDGTSFLNRVRWSHPNKPESWRSDDYIDVAIGEDGDVITGIVPWRDKLLVFKRRSVHVVYGGDPNSFAVQPLSSEVGAPTAESVVATPDGVYFWDEQTGVWLFDGQGLSWQFEKLQGELHTNEITPTAAATVALSWVANRLWVSVDRIAVGGPTWTYVLDPSMAADGCWTQYDFGIHGHVRCFDTDLASRLYTEVDGTWGYVFNVAERDVYVDTISTVPATRHITSHLRTSWFDASSPGVSKQWRRPDLIVKDGFNSTMTIESFEDYDPRGAKRSFQVSTSADGTSGVYGTGTFGTSVYALDGEGNVIVRGSSLGVARAVSLRINGPVNYDGMWGLDGMVLKFVRKRVRG